jgi:hypothetical protein
MDSTWLLVGNATAFDTRISFLTSFTKAFGWQAFGLFTDEISGAVCIA